MRSILLLMILCALAVMTISQPEACGDKFLVVGRGVAYQRTYTAPHPASILIFKNENPGISSAIKDIDLQATLGMAGHKFQVVETASALEAALKSGRFDIVLTDLADATAVEHQVQSGETKPVVLPVIYNPSREDLSAAREQYKVVLKSPTKTGHLLAVIDDAMASRTKERG